MTQDTPAPAAAAELNAEIARLIGWTTVPRGNGYLLVDPANNERWDGASHIEAECWRVVPQYDRDPAAAFGLMAYVCQQTLYGDKIAVRHMRFGCETKAWEVVIEAVHRTAFVPDVFTSSMGDFWAGEADTPERATAIACRDALAALREAEGEVKP